MTKLLAVLALLLSFCTGHAHQTAAGNTVQLAPGVTMHARDDVDDPGDGSLSVPPVPAHWVRVQRGPLDIAYPPEMAPVVGPTLATAEHSIHAVAVPLGLTIVPQLTIRLVRDADEMRLYAPANAPPPAYATGVAYPSLRLALVAAMGPQHAEASEMPRVLRHELSHLALAEATGHAAVPRWLTEGVAVEQSGEQSFERFETLARASFTRGIVPLDHLDASFNQGQARVDEAYAQSADFVAYLRRADGGPRFAVMLAHIRNGESLDVAARETYGQPLHAIEADWRRDLSARFAFAPLWAGSGFLSIAGIALVVVAMVRRRKRSKTTLARWAREERLRMFRRGLRVVTPGLHSYGSNGGADRMDDTSGNPRTLH